MFESALDSAFRRARYSRAFLFISSLSSSVCSALLLARYSRCFLFLSSLLRSSSVQAVRNGGVIYIHGVVCMYVNLVNHVHGVWMFVISLKAVRPSVGVPIVKSMNSFPVQVNEKWNVRTQIES